MGVFKSGAGPVLETIESSHVHKIYPSTSLDESSIEFEFETDGSIYLDMREINLQIKVGLQKGRLFDDFKKKNEQGRADMGMSFTDDDLQYLEWSLWTQGFNFY